MDDFTTTAMSVLITEVTKRATSAVLDRNWLPELEQGKRLLQQLLDSYAQEQFTSKYVTKILKIRTLHSPESDVYLNEIYTPLTLRASGDGGGDFELRVKDDKTIEHSGIVNIVGIAGQGKSTVMRKLFWEELKKSKRIPFFIELRKVETTIFEYLKETLKNIGIMASDDDISFLLQSKRIVLMLDGFDEIRLDYRPKILKEITDILNLRYQCPIITSSRPDTEICREVGVNSYTVQPLDVEDVCHLLIKLNANNKPVELVDLVRNNEYLQQTLVTPILVNLLFVSYPYLDSVPESVPDFYSKLFMTLFQRHDKIKNYTRERKSNYPDEKINDVFNSFCFNSLNKGDSDFTSRTLNRYITSSLDLETLDSSEPQLVWSDIIDITCLLQQDGYDRYLFLHKSIQEFHAAQFLADCRHERKVSIYSQILDKIDIDHKWDNVINFLSKVDENDFSEMFLIKKCQSIDLNHINTNKETVLSNAMSKILGNKYISISYNSDNGALMFNGRDYLQSFTFISTFNLIEKGNRNLIEEVEKPVEDSIRRLNEIMSGIDNSMKSEDLIEKILSISKDRVNSAMAGERKLEIPIEPFLQLLGFYDVLNKVVYSYLMSYYRGVYKPKARQLEVAERILDLEFRIS